MKNNIHDEIFFCPKCGNRTLTPVDGNRDTVGIGYHDLCICEEYAEPQIDFSVIFVDIADD